MKRFILGVCAIAVAAAMLLSVRGNDSENQMEMITNNVEALARPEVIIGDICRNQPNYYCIYVWPDEVYVTSGVFI